jgi:phage major head subunit gpT-like protein
MPLINQSVIDTANTAFLTKFEEMFQRGDQGFWKLFTEIVPAKSENITINFLGDMPTMREWVGNKVYQVMRAYSQTAKLKTWEKSFYLYRKEVEYDMTGMVGTRINQFMRSLDYYDKMVTDVLVGNPTGYDGVALFSASHPNGPAGATQSNVTTSALSFATFEAAQQAGAELRSENSEPMFVTYDTLMVGPKNQTVALEIADADERKVWVKNDGTFGNQGSTSTNIVGGISVPNVYVGKYDVVINPRLVGAYDDYAFLLSTKGPIKPIVVYEGKPPTAYSQIDMEGEKRFNADIFAWSVEADSVAVAGPWQAAYAFIL